MKWAVNVPKKTLTIMLEPWEVMELFMAIRRVGWTMYEVAPMILTDRLEKVVRSAMEVNFPQAFPGKQWVSKKLREDVERVLLEELCDEG